MKGITVLSTALTTVTFLHFASVASITLPSQTDFLDQLLGEAADTLEDIGYQLEFRTNVSADNLLIIQCFPNGTNTSLVLSGLISGSSTVLLDVNTPIVLIVHGYTDSGNASWINDMVNAYHQIGITNTFALDWSYPATQNYLGASLASKNVGQLVGNWLFNLQASKAFSFSNLHLIGHSLGAHVTGFIGKTIFNLTGADKVGRISGLDVAGPLFEYPIKADESNRFSSNDADLVEAYHTDKGFLGFLKPVGTQDFYINNGGPIQPSCTNIIFITAMRCSHSFSHKFFTNSITTNDYLSRECAYNIVGYNAVLCSSNEVVIMGQHNNGTDISGVFYGNTDSSGDPAATT